jgi:hypothetical protein
MLTLCVPDTNIECSVFSAFACLTVCCSVIAFVFKIKQLLEKQASTTCTELVSNDTNDGYADKPVDGNQVDDAMVTTIQRLSAPVRVVSVCIRYTNCPTRLGQLQPNEHTDKLMPSTIDVDKSAVVHIDQRPM